MNKNTNLKYEASIKLERLDESKFKITDVYWQDGTCHYDFPGYVLIIHREGDNFAYQMPIFCDDSNDGWKVDKT